MCDVGHPTIEFHLLQSLVAIEDGIVTDPNKLVIEVLTRRVVTHIVDDVLGILADWVFVLIESHSLSVTG